MDTAYFIKKTTEMKAFTNTLKNSMTFSTVTIYLDENIEP